MCTSRRHTFSKFDFIALALFAIAGCGEPPQAPSARVSTPHAALTTATASVVIGPSGYAMLTLPLLAGATGSEATAINDHGDVVGTMFFPVYGSRAVIWGSNGSIVTLATPPGGYTACAAADINNTGWVVGRCWGEGAGGRPFLYTSFTGMLALAAAPFGTFANAVSDDGVVVGGSWSHTPWRWSWNDGYQVLATPANYGDAYDVTGPGNTVGSSPAQGLNAAHVWSPNGSSTSLGWLPGGKWSVATGISSSRWIVGYAEYSSTLNKYHAFLWTWFAGMKDLGPLSSNYSAEDVNAKGRIVGRVFADQRAGTAMQAWTWKDGTFAFLPTPSSLGSEAVAVSSCGTVVGTTMDSNYQNRRAVRWVRRVCDG